MSDYDLDVSPCAGCGDDMTETDCGIGCECNKCGDQYCYLCSDGEEFLKYVFKQVNNHVGDCIIRICLKCSDDAKQNSCNQKC